MENLDCEIGKQNEVKEIYCDHAEKCNKLATEFWYDSSGLLIGTFCDHHSCCFEYDDTLKEYFYCPNGVLVSLRKGDL